MGGGLWFKRQSLCSYPGLAHAWTGHTLPVVSLTGHDSASQQSPSQTRQPSLQSPLTRGVSTTTATSSSSSSSSSYSSSTASSSSSSAPREFQNSAWERRFAQFPLDREYVAGSVPPRTRQKLLIGSMDDILTQFERDVGRTSN